MSIFCRKTAFAKSGFFNGFTDWHCHILPGVDDGFKTIEDSLAALSEYEKAGVQTVWLTPHIMEDMPNTVEKLQKRFEDLKSAYSGPVTLNLASENMLDNLFEERLEKGELLPLPGNCLLVETSYYNPPMDLDSFLRKIQSKGYRIVLAHPERYIYMSDADYEKYHSESIQFQLNLGSLIGAYGSSAKAKAEKLLRKGYYSYVGTDLHSMHLWEELMKGKIARALAEKL